MLNCKEITGKASQYLDRELSWRQRMAFRLHLLLCHHCHTFIHNLDRTILMVQRKKEAEDKKERVERICKQVLQVDHERD